LTLEPAQTGALYRLTTKATTWAPVFGEITTLRGDERERLNWIE
jgi:hypothetical protein